MTYHPLARETCGDEIARVAEAHTICKIVEDLTEQMTQKEQDFVGEMVDCAYCTAKQLFWLRDIKDKYL